MNMKIPVEGRDIWALGLVHAMGLLGPSCYVFLFKNNLTVTDTTVWTDLVGADFPGAAAVFLDGTHWVDDFASPPIIYCRYTLPPVFTCTGGGGQLVYGWGMLWSNGFFTHLMAAQNFDTPRNMLPGWQEVLDPFRFGINTLV